MAIAVGTSTETDSANAISSVLSVGVTVDDITTANRSPVLWGTCATDGTTVNVTSSFGFDYGSTTSLSGVWRLPVNPHVITQQILTQSSQTTNGRGYVNSPYIVGMPDGRLLEILGVGDSHVGDDTNILGRISADQGVTWTSQFTIADHPTQRCGNFGGGFDPATGWFVCQYRLTASGVTQDVVTTISKDLQYWQQGDSAPTFTAEVSLYSEFLGSTAEADVMIPFDPMHLTGKGLMQVYYRQQNAQVLFSYDHGETWGDARYIYQNYTLGAGEPAVFMIDKWRIVIIARGQNLAVGDGRDYVIFKSSDGGATWSSGTREPAATSSHPTGAPCRGIVLGDDVLGTWCLRSPTWKVYYNRVNKEDFWTDPHILFDHASTTRQSIYDSISATNSNFGYSWLCPINDTDDYTAILSWYDQNATMNTDYTDSWYQTAPRL